MTADDMTAKGAGKGKVGALFWHEKVLRERIANPSTQQRMTVEEARQRLKAELLVSRES